MPNQNNQMQNPELILNNVCSSSYKFGLLGYIFGAIAAFANPTVGNNVMALGVYTALTATVVPIAYAVGSWATKNLHNPQP